MLALLAELRAEGTAADGDPAVGACPTREDLRRAGVLPVPVAARRPASVLDRHEEGPEGQSPLLRRRRPRPPGAGRHGHGTAGLRLRDQVSYGLHPPSQAFGGVGGAGGGRHAPAHTRW